MGAAIAVDGGGLFLESSILVGSIGAEAIANASAAHIPIVASLVWDNAEGDWLGEVDSDGLATGDPMFSDTVNGDWTLRAGSPGLDSGMGVDHDGTIGDIGLFGGGLASVLPDEDGDGFVAGRDCNDHDALMNEAMPEAWYDGFDGDCDGMSDFDADGDGWDSESQAGGGDCDDWNPDINPDAGEVIDGIDSDCDGVDLVDGDGDGFGADADCDDTDPDVWPGAEERWYNGIDEDCAGDNDFDADADGHDSAAHNGDDCDDADPFVNPSAPEISDDGIDNDCADGDAVSAADGDTTSELVGEGGESAPEEPEGYDGPRLDSLMATGGCSSVSGLPAWGLAAMAFLMTMFRRRRT